MTGISPVSDPRGHHGIKNLREEDKPRPYTTVAVPSPYAQAASPLPSIGLLGKAGQAMCISTKRHRQSPSAPIFYLRSASGNRLDRAVRSPHRLRYDFVGQCARSCKRSREQCGQEIEGVKRWDRWSKTPTTISTCHRRRIGHGEYG